MFKRIREMFSTRGRDEALQKHLEELRHKTPVPVFWLYGKTQSGKTTLVKYLTGAEEAEIGQGFRPCTKFSRQYEFPTADAPLMMFLDTRGMDEPGYDPSEDLGRFDQLAHVIVVTVKAMDHSQQNVINHLRTIRRQNRDRPIVLVLTCLHEGYPQQQHLVPYDSVQWFAEKEAALPEGKQLPADGLRASLQEQAHRFVDLCDFMVPIDLTRPEEGFNDPNYGGDQLKEVLLNALPAAYRQTLIRLDEASHDLQDLYAQHALPHILAYSSLAATAGAIPIPGVDLLIVPGIQTRMIYHLARFYGQPLSGERFLELASTLGLGLLVRQATRQVVKFIPFVGSVMGAALAGGATFALGKAFCYYYSAVHRGQVPKPEEIRKYYQEQLDLARRRWKETIPGSPATGQR